MLTAEQLDEFARGTLTMHCERIASNWRVGRDMDVYGTPPQLIGLTLVDGTMKVVLCDPTFAQSLAEPYAMRKHIVRSFIKAALEHSVQDAFVFVVEANVLSTEGKDPKEVQARKAANGDRIAGLEGTVSVAMVLTYFPENGTTLYTQRLHSATGLPDGEPKVDKEATGALCIDKFTVEHHG